MEPVENESSDHKEVISSSILREKIAPLENAVLRMEKIMADTQSRIRKLIISPSSTLSQDISSSSQTDDSKAELEVAHAEKDTEVSEHFFSDGALPEIWTGISTPCDSSTSADETYVLNNREANTTSNNESNQKKEDKDLTMPRITAQDSGHSFQSTEVCSSTTEELVVTSSNNLKINNQPNGDAIDEQISCSDEDTIVLGSSDDERGISDETESGSDNIAIKLYDVDDESLSYNDVTDTKDSSNILNETKKHPNESGKVNEAISSDLSTTCNRSCVELDTYTKGRRSLDGERNDSADIEQVECDTEVMVHNICSNAQNMDETNDENDDGNFISGEVVIDSSEYDKIDRTLLADIDNVSCIPDTQKVINKDEMIDDQIATEKSFEVKVAPKNTVSIRFATGLLETSVVPQEAIECGDENETNFSSTNNCTEEAEIVDNFEKDSDDQKSEEFVEAEEGATEFDDGKVENSVVNCIQENEVKTKSETITDLVSAGLDDETCEGSLDVKCETYETTAQGTKEEDTNMDESSGIFENMCNSLIISNIVDNDKCMEVENSSELPKEKSEIFVRNSSDTERTEVKSETSSEVVSAGNEIPEVLTEIKSETSETAFQKTEVEDGILNETSDTLEGCNNLTKSDIVYNDQLMEVSKDGEDAVELNKEKVKSCAVGSEEEAAAKFDTCGSMTDITIAILPTNDNETQEGLTAVKSEKSVIVQKTEVENDNLDETLGTLEDSCNDVMDNDIVGNDKFIEVPEEEGATELIKDEESPSPEITHYNLLESDVANENVSIETSETGIVSEEKNEVDIPNEKKESVDSVELAVAAGNYEEVRKILSSGISGSLNALIEAVRGSHVEIFDCLFQAEIIKTVTEAREVLSVSKHACIASTILEAWPNAVKGEESAPLLLSVANNEEVLDVVLNAGGKVFLEEALHKILRNGDVEIFSKLVSKMTNVNCAVCCGQTLLHLAAEYNNVDCISVLLKYGANIECTDRNGYTAIQRAAAFSCAEAVNILCNAGAIYDPLDKIITKSFYCCPNYKRIGCK